MRIPRCDSAFQSARHDRPGGRAEDQEIGRNDGRRADEQPVDHPHQRADHLHPLQRRRPGAEVRADEHRRCGPAEILNHQQLPFTPPRRSTARRRSDGDAIGAGPLPFVQRQAIRLEQRPDLARIPSEHLIENRHHHRERVVAEHRAPGDSRELLVLGDGNREAVAIVDVQHDVHVGTAVADVDRALRLESRAATRAPRRPQPFRNRPARARSIAPRRTTGSKSSSVPKMWSGCNDTFERRLNHFARRRRDHEERELTARRFRARGIRPAPGCCCGGERAVRFPRGARVERRGTRDRGEAGRPAPLLAARDCCARALRPCAGIREAPISSLRASPESLKLSV